MSIPSIYETDPEKWADEFADLERPQLGVIKQWFREAIRAGRVSGLKKATACMKETERDINRHLTAALTQTLADVEAECGNDPEKIKFAKRLTQGMLAAIPIASRSMGAAVVEDTVGEDNAFFQELLQGMNEAIRHSRGEDVGGVEHVRWVKVPPPSLTFADFHHGALNTWSPTGVERNDRDHVAYGLLEEAGEFAGKFKRWLRGDYGGGFDGREAFKEAALSELGDVLWYADIAAMELGSSLEAVARKTLAKLADRKARGKLKGSGDVR